MRRGAAMLGVCFLIVLGACTVQPVTVPFAPTTVTVGSVGDVIEVHVTGWRSACERFTSSVSGPTGAGVIRVDLRLVSTGAPVCTANAVVVDETVTIGPVGAGAYTVQVAGGAYPVEVGLPAGG